MSDINPLTRKIATLKHIAQAAATWHAAHTSNAVGSGVIHDKAMEEFVDTLRNIDWQAIQLEETRLRLKQHEDRCWKNA